MGLLYLFTVKIEIFGVLLFKIQMSWEGPILKEKA
jgi:hypothetical protein